MVHFAKRANQFDFRSGAKHSWWGTDDVSAGIPALRGRLNLVQSVQQSRRVAQSRDRMAVADCYDSLKSAIVSGEMKMYARMCSVAMIIWMMAVSAS